MFQPSRSLARTLLVPAALAAVAFAGQSAASASTHAHFAPVSAHFAPVSASATPHAHFASHFGVPRAHF